MSASFKAGVICKYCAARGVSDSRQLAIAVDGELVCAQCGWKLGKCADQDIPDEVGAVLQVLIQDCFLRVKDRNYESGSTIPKSVTLSSRSADHQNSFECALLWIELSYEEQLEYSRGSQTFYTPETDKQSWPLEVDQALRVLTERYFALAEWRSEIEGRLYARLGRNFGNEIKGPNILVLGNPADLPRPRVLRVIVELTWTVASSLR